MNLILNNPAGLWALLGLPAVCLIHFFQRKSRPVIINTYFLLNPEREESPQGQQFERLRTSIPFWLQLLAVLLITWLLVEPRWPRANSTQQIAFVLDESASMSAFRTEITPALLNCVEKLRGPAPNVQIHLYSSNSDRPKLATLDNPNKLAEILKNWKPTESAHDPKRALQIARSHLRQDGSLLFVTDHLTENLPYQTGLLAIGHPTPNLGFAGVTIRQEEQTWQATIRNYSNEPATATWHLRHPQGTAQNPTHVQLGPRAVHTLKGTFPSPATTTTPSNPQHSTQTITLHLEPDSFPLDNHLPLILPQPKPLRIHNQFAPQHQQLAERLLSSMSHLQPTDSPTNADLTLQSYDPLQPIQPTGSAIITVHDPSSAKPWQQGPVINSGHPLTEHLQWQGLRVAQTLEILPQPDDEILVWQGQRPLIFLRTSRTPPAQQLIFNFDLLHSNALKMPALAILIHRFLELQRKALPRFQALMAETNQPYPIALPTSPNRTARPEFIQVWAPLNQNQTPRETPITAENLKPLIMPSEPGFLTLHTRDPQAPLLQAAVHFADGREADLRQATSTYRPPPAQAETTIKRHTHADPLRPYWLLLLLTALLLTWHLQHQKPLAKTT